jgi:hypothetical protein
MHMQFVIYHETKNISWFLLGANIYNFERAPFISIDRSILVASSASTQWLSRNLTDDYEILYENLATNSRSETFCFLQSIISTLLYWEIWFMCWCSYLSSGDILLEPLPGHRLSSLRVLLVFLSPYKCVRPGLLSVTCCRILYSLLLLPLDGMTSETLAST